LKLLESVNIVPTVDGITPTVFTIDKDLPVGLQFSRDTGTITGSLTDDTFGESDFLIRAQDSKRIAQTSLSIRVATASQTHVIVAAVLFGVGGIALGIFVWATIKNRAKPV
jgi:hypothetical protein